VTSLRARLLVLLVGATLLAAAVQGAFAYRTARAEADALFDWQLERTALSLRAGLPMAQAPALDEAESAIAEDFAIQIWRLDGTRIFRSSRGPLPPPTALGFADVQVRGTAWRVFSLGAGPQVIQVAQELSARRAMAGGLAVRTVLPTALMAPLLALLVGWVVTRALAPVARVRREVAERGADALGPVAEGDVPDEIRPLVQELNLLFARVRRAFDAQQRFVADAAHELRSPLAALRLQAQGLQRAGDAAARAVAAERLVAGIDRATRLVEQLLALARHEAGAAAAPRAPVDLDALAREAVAEHAPAAAARRIDLGIAEGSAAGRVDGHADALRILLANLVDNAVKHVPEGGTVDVAVAGGPAPRLVVEDSGPGIPEAERERVLDRFHRVAGTEAPGAGLGLAIVRSVAALHGAALALGPSERLGGLRVEVAFPAAGGAP
jgi:two-component system OmpR family sensor kinase